MSSIEAIQQTAMEKYLKNLQYFQENHPDVHKKLMLLDSAINNGAYSENYTLEYKDDGFFDLKSNITGEYLYGTNAILYSQQLVQHVNKSKEQRVIEGLYRHYFTREEVEKVRGQDPREGVESCVLPVIDHVYRKVNYKHYMRHIKKFIFFGTGLGYHLPMIDRDIREPAIYLIIEDDIELFRLSLFVTDYTLLNNNDNHLFFTITDDTFTFRKIFDDFFDMGYLHNTYIKYLMFFDSYQEKFNLIQQFIVGQSHLGYTYDRVLQKYILALKPVRENYRFLNISRHFQDSVLKDKPLLFLAAGPSLQKEMAWLKENRHKFVVMAVFMILPVLEKEGITPDIIVHIDEQKEPIQRVLNQVDLHKYATDSIFVFAPGIDIDWFEPYNIKERTFMIEDRTHYKIDHGSFQFASVGETGYALSLLTGSKEIYVLGLDLAFDAQSGSSHINGHGGSMNIKQVSKNVSLRETFLTVRGNFQNEVTTNPLFHESILYVHEITEKFKLPDQKVYNLSDGALLEGMIPLKPGQVDVNTQKIPHQSFSTSLLKTFNVNSSTLTEEEMALFKIRYENLLKKKKVLKRYYKGNSKSFEGFLNDFIELAIELTINKDDRIAQSEQILSVYLHYAGVYISEYCNTAGIEYDKKDARLFRKVLTEQFERIIVPYQKAIEEIL